MKHKLILVSHHLCPYVQRAAISLAEKGVPLLRVQRNGEETAIFESAVILEFLEETQANPLHPADP